MNDRYIRVIKKYYEFITTKVKLIFLQKKYTDNGVTLKYILKKQKDSSDLVVIFSSCTRRGIKARYNYMRTLSGIKANQLYILDDFASDRRGSYYLGENFSFNEEKATLKLVNHIADTLNAKKIICCGSSKGGYSALNFGLQIENSYIVAGGPQYYLCTYLHDSSNLECLEHILGEATPEKEEYLDKYLENRIRENSGKYGQKLFLHFSDKEHTYFEHIQFLVSELEKNGLWPECDIASYTNHSEISYYFPDFLKEKILKILD